MWALTAFGFIDRFIVQESSKLSWPPYAADFIYTGVYQMSVSCIRCSWDKPKSFIFKLDFESILKGSFTKVNFCKSVKIIYCKQPLSVFLD